MYVVRIRNLGLTAYGDTEEAAKKRLEKMFSIWINIHINKNTGKIFEKVINKLDVTCEERADPIDLET